MRRLLISGALLMRPRKPIRTCVRTNLDPTEFVTVLAADDSLQNRDSAAINESIV